MSVYEKLEKWKDGTIRYVERDSKTKQFIKSSSHKFRNSQRVGVWQKEGQQKIVPEINHKEYVKGEFYRASVSINVPLHSTKGHPNYKNYTFVKIDLKDNIDIKDMIEQLISHVEHSKEVHYSRSDFWFPYDSSNIDIQYPKPYYSREATEIFEDGEII
jgi:hypothetical protein